MRNTGGRDHRPGPDVCVHLVGVPAEVVEVQGSMAVVSTSGSSYQVSVLVAPSESEPGWVAYTTDGRKIVLTGAPTVIIDPQTVRRFGEVKKEEVKPTDG